MVTLQVMPFEERSGAPVEDIQIAFGSDSGDVAAFAQNALNQTYVDGDRDTRHARALFEACAGRALPPDETQAYLASLPLTIS